MEWAIPIQNLEPKCLRIGGLRKGAKPIVSLSYSDGDATFVTLTVLLPMLPVKSYDAETGKLVLSLTGQAGVATKLQALQDSLLLAVAHTQASWFPGERHKDIAELREGFQPLIENSSLHLYCPVTNGSIHTTSHSNDVQVYSKGVWSRGVGSSLFSTGAPIRVALRIQGLSFHQHHVTRAWTGKFRLQHRILAILAAN